MGRYNHNDEMRKARELDAMLCEAYDIISAISLDDRSPKGLADRAARWISARRDIDEWRTGAWRTDNG